MQGGIMKTLTAVLLTLSMLLLVPLGITTVQKIQRNQVSTTTIVQQYEEQGVPLPKDTLQSVEEVKTFPVKEIITLEDKNMVVLRGPVTEDSVAGVMTKVQKISRKLSKNSKIYLVLDTPGGSVFDGLDMIDFVKAVPQKVHTITLFAASMGFQIAQNLDDRLITPQGTLMSHRARGGVNGQFDGELEERYKMVKRKIDYMDHIASKRMGLTMTQYKKLILNEYWVHGFDSIDDKAADRQVLLRCGASLDGSEIIIFQTFFGPVEVEFSKCPMIRAPISVKFPKMEEEGAEPLPEKEQASYNETKKAVNMSFNNKRAFVENYILTNKFHKIFK
jgi:ATP-dependent protease ClpP protease subunit